MNDAYCSRCDVFGHYQGSGECDTYFTEVEKPHHDEKRTQIGEIRALADDTEMWPHRSDSTEGTWFVTGTPVRISDWTPWRPGFAAGDYWSIRTLDGQFSATQIYDNELKEPSVLDKLAQLKEEDT